MRVLVASLAVILLLAVSLSACGKRGTLRLPTPQKRNVIAHLTTDLTHDLTSDFANDLGDSHGSF